MKNNIDEMFKFSSLIMEKVKTENIEYIDAITTFCEENELEIESIINLISPSLKLKMEEEALSLRLIKKDFSYTLF